jgi:uncharacterized repeat protein (TIGR01451 family)
VIRNSDKRQIMKAFKIPALVLAAVLQLAPILRVVCVSQAAPPCSFAIVLKFLAGAAALLGTYHAVSAASAAIAGVSSTNPIGPVTTNAVGKVGQPFSYRIIVTNPGKDHAQDLWNAAPLPPGLTINTNLGGNGFITGTPTAGGVYPVTLTAGNANSDIVVHLDITINIQGTASSPPSITGPPTNQIATVGATVSFSVQASGDGLAYQWLFNGNPLQNATASTLMLSNVGTNQSGFYSVIVSNSVKAVPSQSAQLLVVMPPGPDAAPNLQILPGTQGQISVSFKTVPGYRYLLLSSDALTPSSWIEVTNVPPAFVGSSLSLIQGAAPAGRFYRVEVSAN